MGNQSLKLKQKLGKYVLIGIQLSASWWAARSQQETVGKRVVRGLARVEGERPFRGSEKSWRGRPKKKRGIISLLRIFINHPILTHSSCGNSPASCDWRVHFLNWRPLLEAFAVF